MTGSLSAARRLLPEVGTIWQGGGMTFVVIEVLEDDVRVRQIVGRNGVLHTPSAPGAIDRRWFDRGHFHEFDSSHDDPWTRRILDRYGYSPPKEQDDPRVCGRCRRAWGSVLVPASEGHFKLFNWRTGKYHGGGEYGETDCGLDATTADWTWPA